MRVFLLLGLLLSWPLSGLAAPGSEGQAIYLQGRLPDGGALVGERAGGVRIEGLQAACAHCHRRSGYGAVEGRNLIPAITGDYLFRPKAQNLEQSDVRFHQGFGHHREAYDEASLARAIREGRRADGSTHSYLMPRYALDDAAMRSLIDHLKGLSSQAVPGVEAETLHFATIVAPEAEPRRRQAMVEVLSKFFADRSAFNRGQSRRMQVSSEAMFRNTRKWQLHVWELTGPADTWSDQLQRNLSAQPVFAVISGLGRDWTPIHTFCQAQKLPCVLPNTELPVLAEDDFYPLYLHAGVLLEADLAARRLADGKGGVLQVYRQDDVGARAARRLAQRLDQDGQANRQLVLPEGDLAGWFDALKPGEQLMLWLRPADLARLPAQPPAGVAVLASALMAGEDLAQMPPAWRPGLRLTYPFDPPAARKVRLNIFKNWLRHKQVDLVDEHLQADTYLAASILADAIDGLTGVFNRDYLLERMESMLSQRLQNGYYPRLGLAPGQRFASKGGYIVGLDEQGQWTAEGDWLVP